jgi:O-antigen/teichoic acid export membrane protein
MPSLKKDYFWNTASDLASSFSSFLVVIFITRSIGLDATGIYTLATALVAIFSSIATFGGPLYQVTDTSSELDDQSYLISKFLTSIPAFSIGVVYIVFSSSDPFFVWLAVILLATECVRVGSSALHAIFQKNSHLYVAGQIGVAKSIISSVLFVVLSYATRNLLLAVSSNLVVIVVFFISVEYPKAGQFEKLQLLHLDLKREFRNATVALRKNFWLFLSSLLGSWIMYCLRAMIEQYHFDMLGYFGIIMAPFTAIIMLTSYIFTPLIVPMTKWFRSGDYGSVNKTVLKMCGFSVLVGLVVFPITYFFGVQLFQLVYAVDVSKYFTELNFLVLLGALQMVSSVIYIVLQIARKLVAQTMIVLIHLVCTVILGFILVPTFGLLGAFLTMTISLILVIFLAAGYYFYALRKMDPNAFKMGRLNE